VGACQQQQQQRHGANTTGTRPTIRASDHRSLPALAAGNHALQALDQEDVNQGDPLPRACVLAAAAAMIVAMQR
jgi:hypothetical protein